MITQSLPGHATKITRLRAIDHFSNNFPMQPLNLNLMNLLLGVITKTGALTQRINSRTSRPDTRRHALLSDFDSNLISGLPLLQ